MSLTPETKPNTNTISSADDVDLILWHAHTDDSDNTYYEACSPYISDGESVDIWWRLRQKLSGDKVVWYADHDGELHDPSAEDEWNLLSVATNYVQRQHDEIIRSTENC